MAARKSKPAPEPAASKPIIELPAIHNLSNPVTVAYQTPCTCDEISIRDAVFARLAIVETAVMDFVAEKTPDGFRLEEIDALYAVELPILFGYWNDGGGIRPQYDGQIIEWQA